MSALATTGNHWRGDVATAVRPDSGESRRRCPQESSRVSPGSGTYGQLVSTTLAVRRDRFSRFVKRVAAHVKATKGWTLTELLAEAKVTKTMYYRWANGTWEADLEGSPIERFCDAAGVDVAEALAILWPGKHGKRAATPAFPPEPELELILRKLNDPNTSKEDLYLIQATLEMLLTRLGGDTRRKRA